jgi:hypothetical protein
VGTYGKKNLTRKRAEFASHLSLRAGRLREVSYLTSDRGIFVNVCGVGGFTTNSKLIVKIILSSIANCRIVSPIIFIIYILYYVI